MVSLVFSFLTHQGQVLMVDHRVYNSRTAVEPTYPATLPSTGDSPAFDSLLKTTDRHARRDSPVDQELRESKTDLDGNDLTILHAPPGYVPPFYPCFPSTQDCY